MNRMLVGLGVSTLLVGCLFGSSGGGTSGTGTGNDGPSSVCKYKYGTADTAEDFGIACTSDSECAHGVCMQPGADGNITNNVFGFCSRGCNCDNSADDARLPSEHDTYSCVAPGGCFPGESNGAWKHAVLKCTSLSDCQAIDQRYTHCAATSDMTIYPDKKCGELRKVCLAIQ